MTKKVFGWAASNNDGCNFYRIKTPLAEIKKLGHEVEHNTKWFKKWMDADILIGQRMYQTGPGATFFNACNSDINYCVLEVDDDLFTVEDHNPAHKYLKPENLRMFRYAATSAQAITVSTYYLANVMSQFNDNVHVIKNALPEDNFNLPPVDQFTDNISIGWQGSPTHSEDWKRSSDALLRVLRANPSVVLRTRGTDYGRDLVEPYRYVHSAWCEPEDLAASLDFQIGLCPIQPTPFNASKSAIKVYEYWVRGIVPIATNYGPYREAITHGYDGFLAKTPKDWENYMSLLINDTDLRQEMSANALLSVQQHRISSRTELWTKALNL